MRQLRVYLLAVGAMAGWVITPSARSEVVDHTPSRLTRAESPKQKELPLILKESDSIRLVATFQLPQISSAVSVRAKSLRMGSNPPVADGRKLRKLCVTGHETSHAN